MRGQPPSLFDALIYPEGVNDQDLESLRFFGVEAALAAPHYGLPHPTARKLVEQFDQLMAVQLPRMERAGIRAFAALGLDPRCLPRRGLDEVLQALPRYFGGGKVVAVGVSGLNLGGEHEEEALMAQLALAKRLKLPAILHTPSHQKAAITRRLLSQVRLAGIPAQQILINRADGKTLRLIRACGHYAGLTVHPDALAGERAVGWVRRLGSSGLVLNSELGSGAGDLTAVARTVRLLAKAGLSERVSLRVRSKNAADFLRVR